MVEGHAVVREDRVSFFSASIHGHMGDSHPSPLVNNAAMDASYQLMFKPLLSILAGIYLQEALLGHVAILCVIFEELPHCSPHRFTATAMSAFTPPGPEAGVSLSSSSP